MTVTDTETETTTDTESTATAACGPAAAPPAPTVGAAPDACAASAPPRPRPEGRDRYTISEVAAICGLSAHTLRWYERIGLMPHVDRSHTGQRRFTDTDLDWLDLVAKLRLTGMPVADMVRYAELVRAGEHTCPERHELLVATREDVLRRIAELQETLAVLDYKIGIYAAYRMPESA
ncbi:DNA-binding transcriptional MerR regulator [Streptomyces sp. Amel2xB2]|uniref:MerR family transcriptional regulator n=1 Tax=Streptomyces nanshensis TaxID=518642 RepID=A0A1E7L7J5_9ACTN|nr:MULTISPECIES: MerR family transcriptional regulator [Streptomyces]OEV12149.1 MerR family transcriptional regulator [Streptomyces nanshensis]RAJ70170.1 DNA-binding transcriptional MerR regulator [Streptomyces sp. Amel2xB2]